MMETNIGDPTFILTGTWKEMRRLQETLAHDYNTIDVQRIGYTGVYLLVAQNRYVLHLNGKRD